MNNSGTFTCKDCVMEIKENDKPKEIEDEGIAKEETHLVEAATLPMMNITQIELTNMPPIENQEQAHQKGSDNEMDIPCEFCVFMTISEVDMEAHIILNHKEKGGEKKRTEQDEVAVENIITENHCCQSCEYKTDKLSDMESHVRDRHTVLKELVCDTCEVVVTTQVELQAHVSS